jgi:hypothetical protein
MQTEYPSIRNVLYPGPIKKWIALPRNFPRTQVCQVLGKKIYIQKTMKRDNPILSFTHTFRYYPTYLDDEEDDKSEASVLEVCRLELGSYLYGPDFLSDAKEHAFGAVVYVNGAKHRGFELRRAGAGSEFRIPQLLDNHDQMYDQSFLNDDSFITIALDWHGWEMEGGPIAVGTVRNLREYQQNNPPAYFANQIYDPRWVVRQSSGLRVDYAFEEEDGFLSLDVYIDTYDPVLWPRFQQLVRRVWHVDQCRGLVNGWLPIEFAEQMCELTSYIVMAFHPTLYPSGTEPVVSILQVDRNGEIMCRKTFDGPLQKPLIGGCAQWRTETHSESVKAYLALEEELHALTDHSLVNIDDAQFARVEEILRLIRDMRSQKLLACQICFVQEAAFKTEGADFGDLHVCRLCSSIFQ